MHHAVKTYNTKHQAPSKMEGSDQLQVPRHFNYGEKAQLNPQNKRLSESQSRRGSCREGSLPLLRIESRIQGHQARNLIAILSHPAPVVTS
jgi:hypothetical protein